MKNKKEGEIILAFFVLKLFELILDLVMNNVTNRKAFKMYDTAVISPCTKVCSIDPQTYLCCGCFRTIEEIITWQSLSVEKKELVIQQAKIRKFSSTKK